MCLIHVTVSAGCRPHCLPLLCTGDTCGQDGDVSHHACLLKQEQKQGESSIPVATEYLGHAVWSVPRQSQSPGMTAPVPGGERGRVGACEVPVHPCQGIAFQGALSPPSLIISRCSAKFLPANL